MPLEGSSFYTEDLLVETTREEILWWYSRALVRAAVIDLPTPNEDRAL
jgi:hypothetical protein